MDSLCSLYDIQYLPVEYRRFYDQLLHNERGFRHIQANCRVWKISTACVINTTSTIAALSYYTLHSKTQKGPKKKITVEK